MFYDKKPMLGLLILLLMGIFPECVSAQTPSNFEEHTKLIRIKKIANEWQGAVLTLHTRNGDKLRGRLIEVYAENYHIQVGAREMQIPLADVIMVSFDPGPPELFLSLMSSFLGASLLGGAMMLATEDASSANISTAALLGMLGGGLWGYSTFYESEIIYLE